MSRQDRHVWWFYEFLHRKRESKEKKFCSPANPQNQISTTHIWNGIRLPPSAQTQEFLVEFKSFFHIDTRKKLLRGNFTKKNIELKKKWKFWRKNVDLKIDLLHVNNSTTMRRSHDCEGFFILHHHTTHDSNDGRMWLRKHRWWSPTLEKERDSSVLSVNIIMRNELMKMCEKHRADCVWCWWENDDGVFTGGKNWNAMSSSKLKYTHVSD